MILNEPQESMQVDKNLKHKEKLFHTLSYDEIKKQSSSVEEITLFFEVPESRSAENSNSLSDKNDCRDISLPASELNKEIDLLDLHGDDGAKSHTSSVAEKTKSIFEYGALLDAENDSLSGSEKTLQVNDEVRTKGEFKTKPALSIEEVLSDDRSFRRIESFLLDSSNNDVSCEEVEEATNQISLLHEILDIISMKCTIPRTIEERVANTDVEAEAENESQLAESLHSTNNEYDSFSIELEETLHRVATRIYVGMLIQQSLPNEETFIPNSSKDIFGLNKAMSSDLDIGECTTFDYDQNEIREVLDKIALRIQSNIGTPVFPMTKSNKKTTVDIESEESVQNLRKERVVSNLKSVDSEEKKNSQLSESLHSTNNEYDSSSIELEEALQRTSIRIYVGMLIQQSLPNEETCIPNSSKDIFGLNKAVTSDLDIGECTTFDYDQDEIREVLDKIASRIQRNIGLPSYKQARQS